MRKVTASAWLVAVIVFCIKCAHGQSIEITSAGLLQDGFSFYAVSCTAEVPGESNALITSEGAGGTASFNPSTFSNVRIFTPISASDSGIYSCTLLVNDVIVDTVTFGIAVAVGSLFMVSVSQQTLPAIAGADYSLTCNVTFIQSAGTATFQWLTGSDESPVSTANGFEVTSTDMSSTLAFSPARQSQPGQYACEATVGAVTIIENATEVVVDVPAIFIRLVPIGEQVLGEGFSFMCEVTIDSDLGAAISYSFTRNGNSLPQPMPFISFQPLTLADAGEYQCSVEIVSPYLTEAIILTAPSATILLTIPVPTVVLTSDTPIPVPHLSSPMLTCTVTFEDVNVAISITVTIDGPNTGLSPLPITDVDNLAEEIITYSSDATLRELEIGRGDGTYTCNAQLETNELQEFIMNSEIGSDLLSITVQPEPRVPDVVSATSTQNTITISWSFTTILDSRNETFTVMYGTTPGELSMTSPAVLSMPSVQQYSVQLVSLQPGTRYYYQIHSVNQFSTLMDVRRVTKTMDARSSAVLDARLFSLDSSTLVVTWQPPAAPNGNILYYSVGVTLNSTGETISEDNVTVNTLTIATLNSGIPYNVSIQPANLAGLGDISTITNFTDQLVPNVSPQDFRVVRLTGAIMELFWTPLTLSEARGFVTAYTVSYRQLDSGQLEEQREPAIRNSGSIVTGLQDEATYLVQVWASTSAGDGERTPIIVVEPTSSSSMSETTTIIASTVAAVVTVAITMLAILVAIVAVVIKRKQNTKNSVTRKERTESTNAHIYSVVDGEYAYETVVRGSGMTIQTNSSAMGEFDLRPCPAYAPVTNKSIDEVRADETYATVSSM